MFDLDPEGLETRCPTGRKRTTKGHFSTKGNQLGALDGWP